MNLTIRARLVGLSLFVSLMTAGPIAVYSLVVERQNYIAELENDGVRVATMLAENLVDPLYDLRADQMERLLNAAKWDTDLVEVYALDRDGRVLSDGGDNPLADQRLPGLAPILEQIHRSPRFVSHREDGIVAVTGPSRTPDGVIVGFVHLRLSLQHTEEKIAAAGRALAMLVGGTFFLCILLSYAMARQFVRPLQEMVKATQSIRRGHFNIHIPVERKDELGTLAQSINQMTEDLRDKTVSKSYVDNIILSMADTLIVTDVRGRIQVVNPAALALLGYKPEQLLGELASLFLGEEIDFSAANSFSLRETTYRTRRGDLVSVSLSLAAMIDEEQQLLGFVLMAHDITERNQYIESLHKAQQLANDATLAKSMFLANMSHEIRTPMNAIIGMSYLALKTELTSRQRDYIDKAHSAAKSLLGIINDILDFSKVEAGKLELEQSRFRLEDVVGNSLSMLRQRAHEKEIELLFDITDPLLLGDSCALLGDSLRLGQIVTNLLSNSVKFTHQGYVKLTVCIEELSDENVLLRFTMRDTGIGMSPEQIGRLFQEFTQADGSTTRKYGGTGLGLTISKKFVELMGGRIWVESTLGEGSSFIFTARFPIALPAPPSVPPLPGVDVLRVLVVDDQPEARVVLAGLLHTLGVGAAYGQEIDCVASGAAALARIKLAHDAGQPYDLLLLDWVMPKMDGGAVLQALKDSGMAHLPLSAVVSAYDSDMMHEVANRLGVQHFLPKPVLPEALRTLLNILTGNTIDEHHGLDDNCDADLNGMRVLLAEDNPINQQLAIELMECRGITVTVANNGQEALDRLAAVAPDHFHLVCMDLQMPVMDGYEATRLLRADTRYFSLPIVAMTAHAMVEERERCLALGMNGHISKPIEPDDLYATLAHYYRAATPPATSSTATPAAGNSGSVTGTAATPQLPEIAGLDTAAGVRRAGKKPGLYLEILGMFAAEYADSANILAQQLANSEWDAAELLAHTLKGLAGTLGANDLPPLAGTLEAACKAHQAEAAIAALSALTPPLTALVSSLHQYFAQQQDTTAPASPSQPADASGSQALPDCLPRLLQLLSEGDSDAIDLWEAHHQEFAGALSPQAMHRIGTALQNFEFDNAQALLAELQVLAATK